MEERKSVLETTKPSDAIGRLTARHSQSRFFVLLLAVVVLFAVVALIGLIISNATRGTAGIEVPKVSR